MAVPANSRSGLPTMPKRTGKPCKYGGTHHRERLAAIAKLIDGTPCSLCGQPMTKAMDLHFHHVEQLCNGGNPRGPRVLVHASCNERDGQYWGARRRSLGIANKSKPHKRKGERKLPEW